MAIKGKMSITGFYNLLFIGAYNSFLNANNDGNYSTGIRYAIGGIILHSTHILFLIGALVLSTQPSFVAEHVSNWIGVCIAVLVLVFNCAYYIPRDRYLGIISCLSDKNNSQVLAKLYWYRVFLIITVILFIFGLFRP